MSLTEIKSAVRELSPKELAELASFISEQDNASWDKEMEADAASGKLDFLFEEAERERCDRRADEHFRMLDAMEEADGKTKPR